MKDSNQTAQLQRLARISKLNYYTLQIVNNKGADQKVRMRRLICSCVHMQQSRVFLHRGPYLNQWSNIYTCTLTLDYWSCKRTDICVTPVPGEYYNQLAPLRTFTA